MKTIRIYANSNPYQEISNIIELLGKHRRVLLKGTNNVEKKIIEQISEIFQREYPNVYQEIEGNNVLFYMHNIFIEFKIRSSIRPSESVIHLSIKQGNNDLLQPLMFKVSDDVLSKFLYLKDAVEHQQTLNSYDVSLTDYACSCIFTIHSKIEKDEITNYFIKAEIVFNKFEDSSIPGFKFKETSFISLFNSETEKHIDFEIIDDRALPTLLQ